MHRWILALITSVVTALAALMTPATGYATPTTTAEAPIGRLGDTLRIQYQDEAFGPIVADVTVHDVVPSEIPPGWGANGTPRWRNQGGPWRANVTIHPISVPNPYIMAASVTFDGVTPGGDAYVSKHTDDPNALELKLLSAPAGATVDGVVYLDVYRGLVTNVVMLNPATGTHLAQWNIWQPGDQLP